jgi:hypothetical protein
MRKRMNSLYYLLQKVRFFATGKRRRQKRGGEEVVILNFLNFWRANGKKQRNRQYIVGGYFFFEGAVMKNIIMALGLFLEGAARIFDFAGALNEEGLHETQDAAAINKDWKAVRGDYKICRKTMREEFYGFKKEKSRKNKP